jgi:hypothetical protein
MSLHLVFAGLKINVPDFMISSLFIFIFLNFQHCIILLDPCNALNGFPRCPVGKMLNYFQYLKIDYSSCWGTFYGIFGIIAVGIKLIINYFVPLSQKALR